MTYTSLHKIITGYLAQRRYPIHFYVEFLLYANRCIEEIHFDTMGNVRVKKLPVNDYGAITLPCDFMDWTKVGAINGQYVKPMFQREGLTRLNNYDGNGDKVAYDSSDETIFTGLFGLFGNYVRYNEKLENTGRLYGSRGSQLESFKFIRERNEIQVNIDQDITEVVLEYISDGQESDNATQVNPYAKSTIEAYINWKHKENGRSYGEGERIRAQRQFDQQYRILRGRMANWTISGIKAAVNKNIHGSIK